MLLYPITATSPEPSSIAMSYLVAVQRAHQIGEEYRVAADAARWSMDISRKTFASAVVHELLYPIGGQYRRDIYWDVLHHDFVNGCTPDAICIMDYMTIHSAVGHNLPLTREEVELYTSRIVDQWWQMAVETIVYYYRHTPRF